MKFKACVNLEKHAAHRWRYLGRSVTCWGVLS